MHLMDRNLFGKFRHGWPLIWTGGDDHIARAYHAGRRLGAENPAFSLAQSHNRHAIANWRFNMSGIAGEIVDDLGTGRKSVAIRMLKRKVWQPYRPVRKLEAQSVPSLSSPSFRDAPALQHQMRPAIPTQHMAHREAGLASANDQRIDLLSHGRRP
jgi:hypothetical protein